MPETPSPEPTASGFHFLAAPLRPLHRTAPLAEHACRARRGARSQGVLCLSLRDDGERVVGHLGASLAGGFSWIINCYLILERSFSDHGRIGSLPPD